LKGELCIFCELPMRNSQNKTFIFGFGSRPAHRQKKRQARGVDGK